MPCASRSRCVGSDRVGVPGEFPLGARPWEYGQTIRIVALGRACPVHRSRGIDASRATGRRGGVGLHPSADGDPPHPLARVRQDRLRVPRVEHPGGRVAQAPRAGPLDPRRLPDPPQSRRPLQRPQRVRQRVVAAGCSSPAAAGTRTGGTAVPGPRAPAPAAAAPARAGTTANDRKRPQVLQAPGGPGRPREAPRGPGAPPPVSGLASLAHAPSNHPSNHPTTIRYSGPGSLAIT